MSGMLYNEMARASLPLTLALAFLMDALIGDPEGFPHPVCLIGRVIAWMEKTLNRPQDSPRQRYAYGVLTAYAVPCGLTLILSWILKQLFTISFPLYFTVRLILCWQLLAMQNLGREAKGVAKALRERGLIAGRRQLSRIVGRETEELSAHEVIVACVETVAENFSDGVVAPLFFLLLFDLPGMFFYKCINTLDSMIAYRDERYADFGRAAAHLDDVANWLPARISALLLLLASILCREDTAAAWKIFRRDRNKHLSPNSGQTESVVAGALHLSMGGPHVYHGMLLDKPYIGEDRRQADIRDIDRSVKLLYWGSFLSFLFGELFLYFKGGF